MSKNVKIFLSIFLSLCIVSIALISVFTKKDYSAINDLKAKEKQILYQLKVYNSIQLFNKQIINNPLMNGMDSQFSLGTINIKDIVEDIDSTLKKINDLDDSKAQIYLKLAVLLYELKEKSKSFELLDLAHENYPEIVSLLKVLLEEKPSSVKDYPSSLITKHFKKDWYRQTLLVKYYEKSNEQELFKKIKDEQEQDSFNFLTKAFLVLLFVFCFWVLGLIIIVIYIYQFKKDYVKVPTISFNESEAPVLDAYFILVSWLSLAIIFKIFFDLFIHLIVQDQSKGINLIAALIQYSLSAIFSLYIIKEVILKKENLVIKDFFSQSVKSDLFIGLKSYFLAIPIVILISLMSSLVFKETPVSSSPLFELFQDKNPDTIILMFIMVSILAPFFEEFLFRGIIFRLLQKKWGFAIGIIASSLLFGIVHFSFSSLLQLSALGLILAWTYQKSGSLLAPMVTHSLWNTAALLTFLFLYT